MTTLDRKTKIKQLQKRNDIKLLLNKITKIDKKNQHSNEVIVKAKNKIDNPYDVNGKKINICFYISAINKNNLKIPALNQHKIELIQSITELDKINNNKIQKLKQELQQLENNKIEWLC